MMTTINDINRYKSITVNPLLSPDQLFELYSVPSFDNQYPEVVTGKEIGSTKVAVQENDVLICKINPRINRVWVVKHNTQYPLIASSEWIVVRSPENDSNYLKWYFSSPQFKNLMVSQVTGIGGSLTRAQPKQVATYPVPLPDFPIQRRIANTLDKVSEGITLGKKMLDELDLMVKAKFVEMLETDYSEKTATEVCTAIVDCPHSTPTYSGCELLYPAIRTSEISNGEINWNSMKYVSADEYQMRIKKLMPQPGDIVYAREGTYGDCVILPAGFSFCLGQRTMLFRPNIDLVNPIYLHQVLKSNYVKRQADKSNTGSTVPHVNVADAKQFHFPLPPIEVQKRFADFSTKINESKLTIRGILDKMETEKLALMQEYFG